ncbi:MAG: type IV toxin-antitoxin system AbiEi family antitoxin [Candidatus Omnitrophica bacterium]|nr:type IV toxin-antitoxin system AbiEi family antitoxin [Candidatus Omnitrophota bacterium]
MGNKVRERLGKKEIDVISRLSYEKKRIVTKEDLDTFFNFSDNARNKVVYRLKKKAILFPIKKGVYVFSPLEYGEQGAAINEMLVPPQFFPQGNYYIGYSTMFNYYNLTEQLFQVIYVLNTSFQKKRKICGIQFNFLRVPDNRMYGLEKIKIEGQEVVISSLEKTLVDLVYFNKPVGGLKGALEILDIELQKERCDVKKFIRFASRFPVIKIRKIIGVALEEKGYSDEILAPLVRSLKNTAISSSTGSFKGKLNKKWKVIINDPQE